MVKIKESWYRIYEFDNEKYPHIEIPPKDACWEEPKPTINDPTGLFYKKLEVVDE